MNWLRVWFADADYVAFKGVATVSNLQPGMSAARYNVSVPQVSLSPSALVQQHQRAMLAAMNASAESLEGAAGA